MPNIIWHEGLSLRGLSGDGTDTSSIWESFARKYEKHPFLHEDPAAYELRVYNGNDCLCHVGYAVENTASAGPFSDYKLDSSFYAIFDVKVSFGYDSENKKIDKWLDTNNEGWKITKNKSGFAFVIECYNSRFKNDGIVEIWVPVHK